MPASGPHLRGVGLAVLLMRYIPAIPDDQWAAGLTESMPVAWAEKLMARWRLEHGKNRRDGNLQHLLACRAINAAHRSGVPADANDAQLCQEASELARDTSRRLAEVGNTAEAEASFDLSLQRWSGARLRCMSAWQKPDDGERLERMGMLARYMEGLHWLTLRGVQAGLLRNAARSIPAALKRLGCERWWRGVLRKIHARAVEATARAIGLVHKRAGCYVSQESLKRREGQNRRNAYALESVKAINEHGQDYTLAELAAKGPANREIRRHELMTRIAGFELIARECSHAAYFATLTCPSRMHAWKTKPGQSWAVEQNKKFDGTLPDEAQRYMCRQWRRFRAAAERAGLELYGFRITEPNHDGTPHWHCLLFFPEVAVKAAASARGEADGAVDGGVRRGASKARGQAASRPAYRVAVRLLRRYFLHNDSADERGARQHRVKLERIDWQRGSAAGYVAKYVAKNIDGFKVEKDLYGNDALTSSQRVDAWASTWRVRQFQQIGGAPVGVWRELRRMNPEQGEQSQTIAHTLDAVNVTATAQDFESEGMQRYTAANGWATYLHLQGGHRVPRRSLRMKVLREQTGELGRYGEAAPAKAVGVVLSEVVRRTVPGLGIVGDFTYSRPVVREVESERATWQIIPWKDQGLVEAAKARLRAAQPGSEAARPWSPVNNCTREPAPLFGTAVERIKKRGRWHRWNTGPGGSTEGIDPCLKSGPPSRSPIPTTPAPRRPAS